MKMLQVTEERKLIKKSLSMEANNSEQNWSAADVNAFVIDSERNPRRTPTKRAYGPGAGPIYPQRSEAGDEGPTSCRVALELPLPD